MLREFVREAKSTPCVDCGAQYPYYVMQFDHIDPATKIASINKAVSDSWPVNRIKKEIEKCEVVCANCHAVRTYTATEGRK